MKNQQIQPLIEPLKLHFGLLFKSPEHKRMALQELVEDLKDNESAELLTRISNRIDNVNIRE